MNADDPARESRHNRRAWLWTSLALFGVGLVITWASLPSEASTPGDLLLPWLGVAMAGLGAASSTATMIGARCRRPGTWYPAATGGPALVLAGLVAVFGAVLALILLADAC